MHTEKGTIKTEAIFSDNKSHRYLLRKEWDIKKPRATIVMTNPSTADLFIMDYTTLYIINNLVKLDFGSVEIVNMVSKTMTKLDTKTDINSFTNEENISHILKSAEKTDKVILAWGKLGENNKKVRSLQNKIIEKLKPYHEKLYMIADDNGEFGFHPLAPQIRFVWHLVKFELPENTEVKEQIPSDKKEQDKKSETSNSTEAVQNNNSEQTA